MTDCPDRRRFLQSAGCGFGALALSAMLSRSAAASHRGVLPGPMFAPRAKRIIFLFMQGGPSHVDTFDYKPRLHQEHGRKLTFDDSRKVAKMEMAGTQETVMKSPWRFRPYGETGHYVSELFPHVARHIDDLCFVHSMHTNGVAHGPSTLFLHTGATNLIRPSVGAWITYGLGSENQNLPGFITICPSSANGGPRNFSNAFLPARYQGTAIGRAGQAAADAGIRHITNDRISSEDQRRKFELLQKINRAQLERGSSDELRAVIQSYELAYRMQMHAPGLTDLSQESRATMELYGIGRRDTDDFGRQCLLARRMAERGVRYVQVNYADNGNNPRWDQHSKIHLHETHARATDLPIAGLLTDLKARGLLEDTLVWWGGEFGRNPFAQGADGRDHNPRGFTHFLCGAGVKAAYAHGATDEFGHEAVTDKVHMHDMHATLLHLLGVDHEQLTYRYAGRDFRLTDVEGRVVDGLLA